MHEAADEFSPAALVCYSPKSSYSDKKQNSPNILPTVKRFKLLRLGAGKRTWTSTKLPPLEPESSASANSAIPAYWIFPLELLRWQKNGTSFLQNPGGYLTQTVSAGARNGTWTRMVFTTRPSNVRVCQFRHSRIYEISAYLLYHIFWNCQHVFLKKWILCKAPKNTLFILL